MVRVNNFNWVIGTINRCYSGDALSDSIVDRAGPHKYPTGLFPKPCWLLSQFSRRIGMDGLDRKSRIQLSKHYAVGKPLSSIREDEQERRVIWYEPSKRLLDLFDG